MIKRRHRHIAIMATVLIAAGSILASAEGVVDEENVPEPPQIDTFFIHFTPYIQPCPDVPLFEVTLAADLIDFVGDPELGDAKAAVEEALREEHWLDTEIDDAQIEYFLATAAYLRALTAEPWNTPHHISTHAEMSVWSFRWYGRLEKQMTVATERRGFAAGYYRRLGTVLPSLDEDLQKRVAGALDRQMQCLEGQRRNALALIEHNRRQYADRVRKLGGKAEEVAEGDDSGVDPDDPDETDMDRLRTPDDVTEAAKAALAEANATRAYLWLNPETTLTIEAARHALTARDTYLANQKLHQKVLQAHRSDRGLRPTQALPRDPETDEIRMEMLQTRARRARLQLVIRELQLEAAFKRSASIMLSAQESLKNSIRDAEKVKAELEALNQDAFWYELPRTTYNEAVAGLGAFAIAFKLSGDVLGTVVSQPLVDGFKDEFIKPMVNPYLEVQLGDRVKNSVEKAYDSYWEARKPLELRQRLLDNLAELHTIDQARSFIAWARDAGSPEAAGSLAHMAVRSVTALLEDSDFVAATDGGLAGIFAPVCNDPTDLAALYVMGAVYEQRGNAKAAASRIAVGRGMAELPESADLGHAAVEKIINPVTNPLAMDLGDTYDPEAGLFANWAYFAAAIPYAFTIDRIWNLPTRVKLGVAYSTTELPVSQDGYLQSLQKQQTTLGSLQNVLRTFGYDYDTLDRRSPQGWRLHTRALTSSHEYSEAYRRIRDAYWKREKQWIWARYESDNSRGHPDVRPELSDPGRYIMTDTVTQEELKLTGLAANSGRLRVRYLSLTGDYDSAAAQIRELVTIEERSNKVRQITPWMVDRSDQIIALEAQGVRDQAVEVYAGLYRTAITQTVVSLASTHMLQSTLARLEGTGWVKFQPAQAATGWSVIREKLWGGLNPWAGKFSAAGVFETIKDAGIESVRTSMSQIAAKQQPYFTESEIDQALDFAFSVTQNAVEDLIPKLREADWDTQADRELYRRRLEGAAAALVELRQAEADNDVERAAHARAELLLHTGNADGDLEADPVLDQLRRNAERTGDALLEAQMNERRAARLAADPSDVREIADEVRKTQTVRARSRLLAEGVGEADIGRLVDPGDSLQLHRRLFTDGFDIQTLRHALTRAAGNDPAARRQLLADSLAIDRLRARTAEDLIARFLETHVGWKGHVGVLRESNRVAVLGDDPTQLGNLDAPGIHVDLEYDLVVREGAHGNASTLRHELENFIETQGYGRPGAEGHRNNLGLRLHYQSEAEIENRGRKSGRRSAAAKVFDGDRLPDDDGDPDEDSDIAKRLATADDPIAEELTARGFKTEHAIRMELLADRIGGILAVRNGNKASLKYADLPDYMAKPMDCKAKTAKVGPHEGLVVKPTHEFQARQWVEAIDAAEASGNMERADQLRADRDKAIHTWETYGEQMLADYGYTVDEKTGLIVKEPFKGIHGDYDLHGVYIPGPDGRLVRASMGDGSAEDNRRRAAALEQANEILGGDKKMFLHGAQDDWDHPGKSADPPVTLFLSAELETRFGRKSPVYLADAAAMRDFYEHTLGIAWEYGNGHGDLGGTPAQGVYKGALYRSVGGRRFASNQRATGRTLSDGFQVSPDWVPIPRWQAYGIALDLAPRLAFLINPQYDNATIAALANTHERAEHLSWAIGQADAILDLVDVWVISQPQGNRLYNDDRRRWMASARSGADEAGTASPTTISESERGELANAAAVLADDPLASRGSTRIRTFEQAGGLKRADGSPGAFVDNDLATLSMVVGMLETGARLDPFDAPGIGGRTEEGVDTVLGLLEWIRQKTAEMYADIGVAFVTEYERMILDGAAVEEVYGPEEAGRIAAQLVAAARDYPGLASAFMRPPFDFSTGYSTAIDRAALQLAIYSDMGAAMRLGMSSLTTTATPELVAWQSDWRAIAN